MERKIVTNEILPRIATLYIDYEVNEFEKYRQGSKFCKWFVQDSRTRNLTENKYTELSRTDRDYIDKTIKLLISKKRFFEEFLKAHNPLQFLRERAYDKVCIEAFSKSPSENNLETWIRALCHTYSYESWNLIYRYAQEHLDLENELFQQGRYDHEIPWFIHERFKDTFGILPIDIQDKIFNKVKTNLDNIRNQI